MPIERQSRIAQSRDALRPMAPRRLAGARADSQQRRFARANRLRDAGAGE